MSILKAIANWRPRTRFYYGWLVLGTAALGTYAATGSAQLVLGGIQNLIFEDLGWDRSTIAFAVTVGTWTAGLITPLFGKLADRYGPRGVMPISLIIVGISFFAFAGVHSVWQFYAAYIVARGLGHPALIGVVPRTLAVNFFQRKRNLALGLSSMARPISASVNIQIISLIALAYSWRVAYVSLGVLSIALAVPLFLILRRRPEDIGLQPDGDTRRLMTDDARRGGSAASPARQDAGRPREFDWTAKEAALTSAFWLIVAAEALTVLTTGAVSFQIVPYLKDLGTSQAAAVGALSISALLGALFNPLWGFLSDRFSPRRLMMGAMAVAAVITVLFVTVVDGSGSRAFFALVLWGAATGGFGIMGSMVLARYYGRASFGAITGLMGPFQTGALGLGPTFGAVLFNLTEGYTALFSYALVSYIVAALLIYGARPPRLPKRASADDLYASDPV